MSNDHAPTKIRKRGRESFIPGEDPMKWCPFERRNPLSDYYLRTWLEGWNQAKRDYEKERTQYVSVPLELLEDVKDVAEDAIYQLDMHGQQMMRDGLKTVKEVEEIIKETKNV